jgi:hypothetical protein
MLRPQHSDLCKDRPGTRLWADFDACSKLTKIHLHFVVSGTLELHLIWSKPYDVEFVVIILT